MRRTSGIAPRRFVARRGNAAPASSVGAGDRGSATPFRTRPGGEYERVAQVVSNVSTGPPRLVAVTGERSGRWAAAVRAPRRLAWPGPARSGVVYDGGGRTSAGDEPRRDDVRHLCHVRRRVR